MLTLGFSACQNESEEPNPNQNDYMTEVEIDGEIFTVNLTPPPPAADVHWEHTGWTSDGGCSSKPIALWTDNHNPGSHAYYCERTQSWIYYQD